MVHVVCKKNFGFDLENHRLAQMVRCIHTYHTQSLNLRPIHTSFPYESLNMQTNFIQEYPIPTIK